MLARAIVTVRSSILSGGVFITVTVYVEFQFSKGKCSILIDVGRFRNEILTFHLCLCFQFFLHSSEAFVKLIDHTGFEKSNRTEIGGKEMNKQLGKYDFCCNSASKHWYSIEGKRNLL